VNNFSNHLPFLSTHLSDIQDELIGRQRDMEVMEQQLEEYWKSTMPSSAHRRIQ
jgi:CHAD domain-containing protein